MRWIFRAIGLFIWAFFAFFLYYTLPQHDIVRIVETEVSQETMTRWNRYFYATSELTTRDIQYIRTKRATGDDTVVYRNEDTGFWPPYFKFDTQDLQTRASDLASSEENPRWVVVRHYGIRSNFFTAFPNALSIREVESPDVRITPWFNYVVLTLLVAFGSAIYIRWVRFKERRIEPMLEGIDDGIDAAGEQVGRVGRWFGGKSKKP